MLFLVTALRYIFTRVLDIDRKLTLTSKRFFLQGNAPNFESSPVKIIYVAFSISWYRWGGVVLINPPVEACMAAKLDQPVTIVPEQTTIVGTFLIQLKLLLGIPEPVIKSLSFLFVYSSSTRFFYFPFYYPFINMMKNVSTMHLFFSRNS